MHGITVHDGRCKGLKDDLVDVVSQTDLVWLLGDLNYRLKRPSDLSHAEWHAKVENLIQTESWHELWEHDELHNAMFSSKTPQVRPTCIRYGR